MGWLHKGTTSPENNDFIDDVAKEIAKPTSKSEKYFELDDSTTGVDIDGYLFFPKQVDSEGFSHREFVRTKIMSGGEFVSRGQYITKEYSFDTVIDIQPDEIDKYLKIFQLMENKVCRVTSPYMGGMFNAEVSIKVTNPESSPHVIECNVTIEEIPGVMAKCDNDPKIVYPSITTVSDISVKEKGSKKKADDKSMDKHVDVYDAPTSSESNRF